VSSGEQTEFKDRWAFSKDLASLGSKSASFGLEFNIDDFVNDGLSYVLPAARTRVESSSIRCMRASMLGCSLKIDIDACSCWTKPS